MITRMAPNMSEPIEVTTSIEIVGRIPAFSAPQVATGPWPMFISTSGDIETKPPLPAISLNSSSLAVQLWT